MPLRVLAVTDFFFPRQGGIERVVLETARRLGGLGISVDVLTRRLDPGAAAEETAAGVRVFRVGAGPSPLAAELPRLFLDGRAFAADRLARYDLVHAHLTLTALPLLTPARSLGIPLVATFYGPWDREYVAELESPLVRSRWPSRVLPFVRPRIAVVLRSLQSRLLREVRRVIVLSRHSQRELGEFGYTAGAPIEHVPGGVDVERFRPRDRAEARSRMGVDAASGPVLVAVRRLVPRMGLEALLGAVGALQQRFPRIRLLLGGDGPLRGWVEAEAARRAIAGRVNVLGSVAEEDLPWLYAAADLCVMPTRALEGFGLPVLEAWAAGVPVASSPVGALAETVGLLDPRLLAASAGAADLEATIGRWLGGERPADSVVSERARSLALSFRWERVCERMASVYERALEAPVRESLGLEGRRA